MELSGAQTNLNLSITVTENGTGIQVMKTQYMWVSSQLASISFDYDNMNQFYKRGLPYSVRVFLKDENDLPLAGEELELQIKDVWDIKKIITGVDGGAEYDIDTSNFLKPNFTISVSYPNTEQCYYSNWGGPDYPIAEYTVYRFYSESASFLQIIPPQGTLKCGQNQKIEVQFLLSTDGIGARATNTMFYYMTMSRSRIVQSGQQQVDLTPGVNGTFSIDLPITPEIAFRTDLLVYTILQQELITDTKSLNVEACFSNQVSLNFSKEIGPPASTVDLQISASPGSLCAVKVIDSSVLLLSPDNGLTPEAVYNSLQNWFSGYQVGEFNVEQSGPPCEDPNNERFYDGNYYAPVSSDSEGDTYNNLKSLGLVVGTDVTVRKPVVCGQEKVINPVPLFSLAKENGVGALNRAGPEPIAMVRKNFTDTWMWTTVSADSSGRGVLSQKVPDSITEWHGSMICTSEKDGVGMSKAPSKFTSSLPFFGEMSLPYSIVRGEALSVTASISNYLEQCVKVEVTLMQSKNYSATLQKGTQNACFCSGEQAPYTWNINAMTLGEISLSMTAKTTFIGRTCNGPNDPTQPPRKDTVMRSIIVEPEGIKREVTSSNFICLQGKQPKKLSLPMKLIQPPNVVLGSASGSITVLGDIIGLSLQNLQDLLQMPYGCGEQNLARMAPIPYLLDYLNTTGQLTDSILQKGIELMNTGYYRQLGYRVWSGAYSLFGGLYSENNSRLTAYVFKTFEKCKKYIYIDENIQQQALIWLENSQKLDSGCFTPIGDPFMRLRDGTDDDISYTAYISIALLESNYSLGSTLLKSSMTCLQQAMKTTQSVYNQALMVYAFTLARDWPSRCSLLKALRLKAITEGGMIHWEREDKPTARPVDVFYPPYSSAEVEMTAYILMSIAKGPNVTQEEMTFMAQVSAWLIRQENPWGGFRSTQDTVVALQALSTFGKLIFNPDAKHNIQIAAPNKKTQITVNKNNRLVVQRQALSVPGDYTIGITGTGCCLIQSTIRYNIPVPKDDSSFLVSAKTLPSSCVDGVAYSFSIGIDVSYRGNRNQTNIVVMDITMLSGYQADYWSLQELVNAKLVSNHVTKNNHLYLYMNTVSSKPTHLSINVLMGNRVLNVKPGSIYVYDSYETAANGYASYRHPCAK